MTLLLEAALSALARQLEPNGTRLLICGGFGLVLRHRHIQQSGATTLMELVPVRSTEDVDLLLTEDIITDAEQAKRLRLALDELGYDVVEKAKHFQFKRDVTLGGQSRSIKFDLLAPEPAERTSVKINGARIRPHGVKNIHARLTPEAFSAHEHPLETQVGADNALIRIVHPFTHMVMKLHALRDRLDDSRTDYGRRHALDLYRLLAMTTEEDDWEVAPRLCRKYETEPALHETRELIQDLFLTPDGRGRLRMREAARAEGLDVDIAQVAQHLKEWFEVP